MKSRMVGIGEVARMTIGLLWEPAITPQPVGGAGDKVDALKIMIETFGRDPKHPLSPIELDKRHILTLRQLGPSGSVFHAVADLIEIHGRLRVWGRD